MKIFAVLLLATACATSPAAIPAVAPQAADPLPDAALAEILVDACTARATDDVLIGHAVILLHGCRLNRHSCVRRVCVRLGDGDRDEPLMMVER